MSASRPPSALRTRLPRTWRSRRSSPATSTLSSARSSSARLGATARASLYVYNDEADVDALCDAIDETKGLFG